MKSMKVKQRIITSVVGLMLTSAMGLGQVQAQTDLSALSKEVEIMSTILKTSLRQNGPANGIKIREVDVMYLASQGLVFEVSTSQSRGSYTFEFDNISDVMVIPEPPEPPHVFVGNDVEVEFYSEAWSEVAEEAMKHAHRALEDSRDQMRELRQQVREYTWEEREYERRLRDLSFEMRNADEERKAELKKDEKELKDELLELKERQTAVQNYSKELSAKQQKKAAETLAAKKKLISTFLQQFDVNVSTTLCKFGNGIDALPENENVSFVMKNFVSAERGAKQDRIYVFSNKDIQACSRDKLTPSKLIDKAKIYTF